VTGIDVVKLKYSKRNLSKCYLIHHKSYMESPGIEHDPSRWQAGDKSH